MSMRYVVDPPCSGCSCNQSPFLYQPSGHVITGDLRIISNRKLRKLISKGPNFREQNSIYWGLCRKLCFEGIDAYRKHSAAQEKVVLTTLNEWACTVKRLVENRLKGCRQNTQKKQTLNDPAGKQTLEKLHEDYVLAPADKAGITSLSYVNNTIRKYLRKSLQITPEPKHTYAVVRL